MNSLSLATAVAIDTTISNPETTIMVGLAILGLIVMVIILLWVGPIGRPLPARAIPPRPTPEAGALAQWYWLMDFGTEEELKEWEEKNMLADMRRKKADD